MKLTKKFVNSELSEEYSISEDFMILYFASIYSEWHEIRLFQCP